MSVVEFIKLASSFANMEFLVGNNTFHCGVGKIRAGKGLSATCGRDPDIMSRQLAGWPAGYCLPLTQEGIDGFPKPIWQLTCIGDQVGQSKFRYP